MASLVKIGEWYSVRYKGSDGKEKKLALKIRDEKRARQAVQHVEELVEAERSDSRAARTTVAWVEKQEIGLQRRLEKAGLIKLQGDTQSNVATVGQLLDGYAKLRSDVKQSTATFYGHTIRNLKEFFGAEAPLAKIRPGDADEFKLWLLADEKEEIERKGRTLKGQGLATGTANRRCTLAGQFFRAADRKGLIKGNPFAGVGGMVKSNKSRMRYISTEDSAAVLDACPDAEWRLIFALSRFGGLRTPSEQDALRWEDVNWAQNRILVHSPKTEHHEGGESRFVPIFPELRPHLERAWEDAEPGAKYVLAKYRGRKNLRTRFQKIIKRAGRTPWPKLFQNLRSTRQTELINQGFSIHLVCAWLGNKTAVALEHYAQVTDEDFAKAAGEPSPNLVPKLVHDVSVTGTNAQQASLLPAGLLRNFDNPLPDQWATQDSNL